MTALTLLGTAAGLAGTAYSVKSSMDAKDEMKKQMNDQIEGQRKYQEQTSGALDKSLGQSGRSAADAQMSAQEQKAQDEYSKVGAVPLSHSNSSIIGGNDNAVVADSGDKMYTKMLGNANAAQQGVSGFNLAQYLKDLQFKEDITGPMFGSQQSLNNFPYQMQQAQHSGDTGMAVGQLLNSVGGLSGIAGQVYRPTTGTWGNPIKWNGNNTGYLSGKVYDVGSAWK